MKIGVIGLGFVGSAVYDIFKLKKIDVVGYDKYKNGGIGKFSDCLSADIIFLCLPTKFNGDSYDLKPIKETLEKLKKYNGLIVIKSTVEPGVTNMLNKNYKNLNICHNPEFLTAKTAKRDFKNQSHIVLGKSKYCSDKYYIKLVDFYKLHWPNAKISLCSSNESEIMKLGCNCFYSVKIQYFNELFLLCERESANYDRVKQMMLNNNWINPMHTMVPGTDGKMSYGGLCFPKDTNALANHMDKNGILNKVLRSTIDERNLMRNDFENIICEMEL